MNNNLILTSLLAVSMAIVGCSKSGNSTVVGSADSVAQFTKAVANNGAIAYIQMDSLMHNYGMFIDMSDEFGKKQKNAENDLNARGRNLEREVMEFQDKAQKGILTRFQISSQEEALQKKQQDFVAHRDRTMNSLGQQEQTMMSQISEAILSYVKEYNQSAGYSMILTTTGGQPVLTADPELNITTQILTELNKRYLESKEKETKKK